MFFFLKRYKILHLDTYKMFLFTNTLLFLAIGAYSFIWIYHGFFILGLSIIVSYYLHFNYFSPLKVSTGSFVIAYLLILGSLFFLTYFYFWFDIFTIEGCYMLKAGGSFGSKTAQSGGSRLAPLSRAGAEKLLDQLVTATQTHPTLEPKASKDAHKALAESFGAGIWPGVGRGGMGSRQRNDWVNNGMAAIAYDLIQFENPKKQSPSLSVMSTGKEEQNHRAPDLGVLS